MVEGFDNTPIKFAKCCSPLPGDPIVGFITRGFGVSIHKQSCVNAISSMKDPTNAPRWVKAYWADSVKDSYKAGIEIVALDRNELLRDVLSALADIRNEVAMLSVSIAEKVLRKELSEQTSNSAFLASIVDEATGKASDPSKVN